METSLDRILKLVEYMRSLRPDGGLRDELRPDTTSPIPRLPKGASPEEIEARWNVLGTGGTSARLDFQIQSIGTV